MSDWNLTYLKDVSELITKGTTPTSVGGKFTDSGINFIKSESLNYEGIIDESVFAFIDEDSNKKLKRSVLRENDILYSIAGIYLGKMGIVRKHHLPANTNQACALIRLKHDVVDYRFIKQYFSDKSFINFVNSLTGQAAQPNINLTDIGNLKLLLPLLPTQQRIASILSAYDELIEVNHQRIKLLEETTRELYKEWFVRMRFPGYKKAKFVKGVPEGFGEQKYFKDFIKLNRGFDLPEEEIKEGEYPVIASTSIKAYHNQFKVKAPVITTGRSGSLGTVLYVNQDGWPLNTSLYVKDFKGNEPLYVYYTLKSIDLESFNSGAGVPSLNQNHLHKLKLWIAGEELQKKFKYLIDPIFQQLEILDQQNIQLCQIRDRLLPRLVSGKLVVKV